MIHMVPDSLSWAQGVRLPLVSVPEARNRVLREAMLHFPQSQPQIEVWWSDEYGDIKVDIANGVTAEQGYYVVAYFTR